MKRRSEMAGDGEDEDKRCQSANCSKTSNDIRSRKGRVDACKTAARAEMLQTHTGGDNPAVCVEALHRVPKHAAADVSNVRHARASAF